MDSDSGGELPPSFDHIQALRIIGYDVKDSIAVIKSFKRKYLQQDKNDILTGADKKVLFTLYRKFE